MRYLLAAIGAVLLVTAATSAAAGERDRYRGDHGRPSLPCCQSGSVNFDTSTRAEAHAYASARSHFNARAYGYRSGGAERVIYVDSGHGGYAEQDYRGDYGVDRAHRGPVCPSAPFGYIVTGFGRDSQRPSWCGYRYEDAGHDRGGRYGYSERHESYGESRYDSRETYEEYEAADYYEERGAWRDERYADHGRDARREDCDCRGDTPYPPAYLPEPPRYDPPPSRQHRRERPRPSQPHRYERNAPGERG